jgi:hypothetical protein
MKMLWLVFLLQVLDNSRIRSDPVQTNPLNSPIEVHEVIVTLEQTSGQPNAPRHVKEKERLSETFVNPKGALPAGHPRHRLLDALHGFTKYQERQKAELDRLRGLYKHASKAQKSVRGTLKCNLTIYLPADERFSY